MSLPKTVETMGKCGPPRNQKIIHQSKGIDESYPKMYFLLNLSHYVESCGHFPQILAFFYDACSLNMVISRDPRSKFRKFLFCPNSKFNIRKSHKISSGKALYFRSYQPKTSRRVGVENTPRPSAFRVKVSSQSRKSEFRVFSVAA